MKFGDKLRQLREEKNLSQKEVAEKLNISLRTYASYELNQRRPRTEEKLKELADFFGKDVDYLKIDDIDKKAENIERYRREEIRQRISEYENSVFDQIVPFLNNLGWETKKEIHRYDLVATLNSSRIVFDFKYFSYHGPSLISIFYTYGSLCTLPLEKFHKTYCIIISDSEELEKRANKFPPVNLNIPIKFYDFDPETKSFKNNEIFKFISKISQ